MSTRPLPFSRIVKIAQRDFWTSRKSAAHGLTSLLSTVVGSGLTSAGGAVYCDSGTMTKRVYASGATRS